MTIFVNMNLDTDYLQTLTLEQLDVILLQIKDDIKNI